VMRSAWIVADSIVSPLGSTSVANYEAVRRGDSGIRGRDMLPGLPPVFVGQVEGIDATAGYTRFEALCAEALTRVLTGLTLPADRTLFILSTTKGNIALLERGQASHERIHLHRTAKHLATAFGLHHTLVISNACISGVMALIIARRYMAAGQYDHAVVLGADELSRFVVSGFQSLSALGSEPCRPFDRDRKGVSLGECATAVVLSALPEALGVTPDVCIAGGCISNDANHISGPSRTGNELAFAVREALKESDTQIGELGFISAHGTATLYNDEMEAKAFHTLGLTDVPVNSTKGSFGHTLGAAGVLETVLSLYSLRRNEVLPTVGFEHHGVSQPITVNRTLQSKPMAKSLKTASGFGGCNAAIVLQKKTNK
jgi:3-oxoacyl-[acyl-carrier-protein] synthase-1